MYIHSINYYNNPPSDSEKIIWRNIKARPLRDLNYNKQEIHKGIWKNKLFDETLKPGLCGT